LAARYARAAELYETLTGHLEMENEKMSQQNKEFAKTNKQLESTVKNLWKDVGIVDTATADLEKVCKLNSSKCSLSSSECIFFW